MKHSSVRFINLIKEQFRVHETTSGEKRILPITNICSILNFIKGFLKEQKVKVFKPQKNSN